MSARWRQLLLILGSVLALAGAAGVSWVVTPTAVAQIANAAASSSAKAKAISELRTAARHLHSAANDVVDFPGGLLSNLNWQFALGEMKGAVRDARRAGLNSLAKTYEAVLERETRRVDFAHFVHRAENYGNDVARKAQEDNPQLTPAQLRGIALNASAWFGNSTLQRNLLASARKVGRKTYEVTVKSVQDLDAGAYKIYRGLSVGAQKTNVRYAGREGLHRLPDREGGMNGGFIGFRRAAETSGGKSPAVDLNTKELGDVKIHFVR